MSMDDNSKLLLTLGPRENQALKEITSLIKDGKIPNNKNEIFRRGFHSAIQLMGVDEMPLLQLLREQIERSSKSLAKNDFELILALSLVIYGTMIVKKGIIPAEPFETIPDTCKLLLIDNPLIDKKDVSKTLHNLALVVDTIFLKNGYDKSPSTMDESLSESKEKITTAWAFASLAGMVSTSSKKQSPIMYLGV